MLTAEANERLTGKGVPGLVGERRAHRLTMMKCGIPGEDGHYAPAMRRPSIRSRRRLHTGCLAQELLGLPPHSNG